MEKLDKEDADKCFAFDSEFSKRRSDLEDAIDTYNTAIKDAREALLKEISRYNQVVNDVNSFIEDQHDAMIAYYYNQSANWRESDEGNEYFDWMNQWNVSLQDCSEPDVYELGIDDILDAFDGEEHIMSNLDDSPGY